MIRGIELYLVIGTLIVLRLSYLKCDIHYYIEERFGLYGTFLFGLILFPILMTFKFYYWNFIECNQYGIKK